MGWEVVELIHVAQDIHLWQALEKKVMNLWLP
jgi:hypothetical protein